ncbi:hypothetical protein LguiB_002666 [Lonicera macranthoides]
MHIGINNISSRGYSYKWILKKRRRTHKYFDGLIGFPQFWCIFPLPSSHARLYREFLGPTHFPN